MPRGPIGRLKALTGETEPWKGRREERREGRGAWVEAVLVSALVNMPKVAKLSLSLGSRTQRLFSGGLTPQVPHPQGPAG